MTYTLINKILIENTFEFHDVQGKEYLVIRMTELFV